MTRKEEIESKLNLTTSGRRHPREEMVHPEEISDPHVLEDESRTTLADRITDNKYLSFFVGLIALAAFVFVIAVGWKVVPHIILNKWTWLGVGFVVWTGGSVTATARHILAKLKRYDWLVLVNRNSPGLWLGYHFASDSKEGYNIFVPVKGFGFLGKRENPYKVGEIVPGKADSEPWQQDLEKSDPASIGLDPEYGVAAQTGFGTVVAQLSSGLRPARYGRETTLWAELPDMAEEERIDDLTEALEDSQKEIGSLKKDVAIAVRQKKNKEAKLREQEDETIDRFAGYYERIRDADRRPRDRSGNRGSSGSGTDYDDMADEFSGDNGDSS